MHTTILQMAVAYNNNETYKQTNKQSKKSVYTIYHLLTLTFITING